MNVKIHPTWKSILADEFTKRYFQDLVKFVKIEYAKKNIYPPGNKIFTAFNLCPFDILKVVILGQDPYHGKGQANGFCFSVNDRVTFPPSLQNIFIELKNDLKKPIPQSGNLEKWAIQGVLLLNTILTVRESSPRSHQNKGWEEFTSTVIKRVSTMKQNIVFILWGIYAQNKLANIDVSKHHVLTSAHPSPYSANHGFFGNKHFSKTNAYLRKKKYCRNKLVKLKLVFATHNKNKVTEVKSLLGNKFRIISLEKINCIKEIPETQPTIKANAIQKAKFIYANYHVDCFADDTGLEVYSLNYAPGVHSARYSGTPTNNEANIKKLLSQMKGNVNREAQFRTVVALILGGKSYQFEGIVKGKITYKKIGWKGFGYDPIFMPNDYNETFAQMSLQEKNKISHRGIAFQKLKKFLLLHINV